MKSYTTLRNLYGSLTNNTDSTNLTLGDQWINDGIRHIIGLPFNFDFLEKTSTDTTVASQQSYDLPYDYDRMNSVTITLGSYKYPIKECPNRRYWDKLQLQTTYTSNYAEWFFIDAGKIYFWPIPSTASLTITENYKVAVRDISIADYTTGTVTLTNGSKTVTGSGTTFSAAFVGRWIRSTVTQGGDGFWYQVAAFVSTTSLTLSKKYGGTTTAGLSYTIGEMPVLPEEIQDFPVWYAVMQYWMQNQDLTRSNYYKVLWEDGLRKIDADYGNKTTNVLLEEETPITNPNLFVTL